MQRVLVIGCAGAGKSRFSTRLAALTGLPLIALDREFWQPGWVVTPRPEWRKKVAALAARDRWVMDGNFDSSLDLRLPRADTLIWFDFPRRVCLMRLLWRAATTFGKVRPDMAPGCPERLDFEFLRFVWNFNNKDKQEIIAAIGAYGRHVEPVIFRRDAEVARYFDTLGAAETTRTR